MAITLFSRTVGGFSGIPGLIPSAGPPFRLLQVASANYWDFLLRVIPSTQSDDVDIPADQFAILQAQFADAGSGRVEGIISVRILYHEIGNPFITWFYFPTLAFSGRPEAVRVVLGRQHDSFIPGRYVPKPPTFPSSDSALPTFRGVSNTDPDLATATLKIEVLNAAVTGRVLFEVVLDGADVQFDARRIEEVPVITRAGLDMTANMAAANLDGNSFNNTGREVVTIRNAGATPVVVRPVVGSAESFPSANVGQAVTVAATTGHEMLGPFPTGYNDNLGQVRLEYTDTSGVQLASVAGLSIGVCRLARPFTSRDV